MEILIGITIIGVIGISFFLSLMVHRAMRKEPSIFSRLPSDVAILNRPFILEKFMSSIMMNGGILDLDAADTPPEVEKFNKIPIYFKNDSMYMERKGR